MYIEGIKHDKGKLDWTLLPFEQVESVVRVLDFGTQKYSRDNWKYVSRDRYEKALMRHAIQYISGEEIDEESKEPHLAHLICNALFLMWQDGQVKKNELDSLDKLA